MTNSTSLSKIVVPRSVWHMGFSVLLSSVVCINFKFSISFPVLSRERNGHYKQDQKRKKRKKEKKRLRIKAMMNNLPGAWVAESAAVSRETFEFHHKVT